VNIATLLGILGAISALGIAIVFCGGSVSSYLDLPSLVEVVIGSYFTMMVSTSLQNALGMFKLMGKAFKLVDFHEGEIVTQMYGLCDRARKEGILALEEAMGDLNNEFMKKGLQMAVDGADAGVIEDMLSLEIEKMQARHKEKTAAILQWALVAPAVGMLGTVIGLVAMMKNLSDKESVGPNMAMALITTLYGAMVAHFFCTPIAIKLKNYDAREAASMEMILEGVIAIQHGENPQRMLDKLLTFLPPDQRKTVSSALRGE
jgi:chemotaxis protein MotA